MSPDAVEVVTETDRCKQLVARLQREHVIAVATEGINVGKEGPLMMVQIGTCAGNVVIFDVLMNRELMNKGRLRVLLEDDKIIKVMHDCSHVSAALNYQFAVTLTNVFDTQVAHLVIAEHKGNRLPQGLKVSDICLQYAENVEKFYTYDWRTDSKKVWMAMIGNFWALRPLTLEMVEFAAGDVIVLIPDVYRHQLEYIEENGFRDKFEQELELWLQLEIDDVIKERRGKRISQTVASILQEMDGKYDDRATLFNILEEDEMNALAIVTYEDAEHISGRILKLKCDHIMADITELELKLRLEADSWEHRCNILSYLRYYAQLPNNEIKEKAEQVLNETIQVIFEHIEVKYSVAITPNMLTDTEKEALLTIPYMAFENETHGEVINSLYWKLIQDELHEMIDHLRFCPDEFALAEPEYEKLAYFSRNSTFVPEEVSSLASGLLHAVRAYSAANGGYVVGDRRRSGVHVR